MKKQSKLAKNSLKNFQFDGSKILKKEDARPTELRAVIYCRVSGDKQVKEGFGLETQEKQGTEWCGKHEPSIEVVKVFREEGESGNLTERSVFEEVISFLKKENSKYIKITHFVCRDLSRISRPSLDDVGAAFKMEKRITQYGVEIVDITGGISDDTDEGKLMKVLKYAVAGYDRNQIKKKCQNGKRQRLMDGYRPFSNAPYGYTRIKLDKKGYVDEINWDVATIMKQGLELFANDPTMGQSQLYNFLVEKGLKGEAGGKLRMSYLEKMFQLHRLYYYAGYCIYPKWDVNELIEGRHEGFISLETAEKIRKKIIKGAKGVKSRKSDDDFILKQLITCKGCGRKLTGRTTVKKKTGVGYSYYGCQLKGCPERDHVPKQGLEDKIINMIKDIQLPPEMMIMFDEILLNKWKEKEKGWKNLVKIKESRIRAIQLEKKDIEKYLVKDKKVRNISLDEKMDENWSELNEEENILQEQVDNEDSMKKQKNNTLKKIRELIKSPLVFREQGDRSLRKQLIEVRFGDSLTYSKSQGLQTADNSVLYTVLCDLKHNNSCLYPGWDLNPHDLAVTRFGV